MWRYLLMAAMLLPVFDEREAAAETADELVRQALEQEIDGTPGRRSELLRRVLKVDPESAAARWQSGYVRQGKEWVHFLHAPQLKASRELSEEYRKLRSESADSFAGHLQLADWCRRNKLPQRERAHLTAALAKPGKSNDAALRARLGFVLVAGRWETRTDLRMAKEASREWRRAFKRWRPKLERIAQGLGRPKLRKASAERLKAIDDPAALPAMEAVFSQLDVSSVLLLVDAYDGIESHQAAMALARQAILSPWDAVREAAARKLQSRPPEAFVPDVIAALHTPIESRIELYVGNGGVRLSQAFFREHQDYKELAVSDAQTRLAPYRVLVSGRWPGQPTVGAARNTARRRGQELVIDAELKSYTAQRHVDEENEATRKRNEYICTMLSTATGVQVPADSKAWWKWWRDYNELYEDQEKPCRYVCRKTRAVEPLPYVMPRSCLAAGTVVWTERGAVAVESVKVGDLALSKNPATGELAYKPVLRTTIRPATQLLKVPTGQGEFHATGGHTFWISGRGWQKIRDVRPGMRFHGAEAPMTLAAEIEEGPEEPTYNLVVADFHTYFVSESMLLSHDPTFAEPTDVLVPGLEAK